VDARSVDHRADIYALGCTMFYLLAARPISPEGSIVQKLIWHQTAPRPSLCNVCTDATERLDMIFQRMVAADPNDRYARMQEVVEDLERVQPELRLGDAELPLVGEELALYIGMDAIRPPSSHSQVGIPEGGSSAPAPLHATQPPQKASPALNNGAAASVASVAAMEQQLAAAAIMIGKEVAAQTADGRTIRGVVNHLSVECHPDHPEQRSVRLHVGSAVFGLHEIREVFYGNPAAG
jgi:serine/threonine protein kinase